MKNNHSRQQLETSIIERASQDATFRQALISDPKAVLANFLGTTLPPNVTITVLEERAGQHYLVLPPASPAIEALRLNDLELALVGGGRTLRPIGNDCNDPSQIRNGESRICSRERNCRTSC